MGGARMHTGESGCGDVLVKTEVQALDWARNYLSYLPSHCQEAPPSSEGTEPPNVRAIDEIIPPEQNKLFDVKQLIDELVDAGSFLEIKQRFAKELVTGLARLDGETIGIVANNSKYKGGVLFVDSADKATRFITLCDAFNIPLLYLADAWFYDRRPSRTTRNYSPRENDIGDVFGKCPKNQCGDLKGIWRGVVCNVRT